MHANHNVVDFFFKPTNSALVYCEAGRFPLKIVRQFRILPFWFNLLQVQNCILYTCYNMLREECDNSKKKLTVGLQT